MLLPAGVTALLTAALRSTDDSHIRAPLATPVSKVLLSLPGLNSVENSKVFF